MHTLLQSMIDLGLQANDIDTYVKEQDLEEQLEELDGIEAEEEESSDSDDDDGPLIMAPGPVGVPPAPGPPGTMV